MNISKFTYEGDAIDGTGGENRESNRLKMLKWLQANPDKCKHTDLKVLAHQLADAIGGSEGTYVAYLSRGLKQGVLSRANGLKRADFRINYFHPSIPQELIDTASEEDKAFIAEVHERAEKMGGEVGNEGEITTKRIYKPAPIEEPTIIERAVVTPAQAEEPAVEQTLPVEVKQTKRGTQITFTININL